MNTRRIQLVDGNVYHVFTKSIADFTIFNEYCEYYRMKLLLKYHQSRRNCSISCFQRKLSEKVSLKHLSWPNVEQRHISLIGYCLMPTHLHVILRQLANDGISIFMNNILNSYSRYFNLRHKRKGPLWESRFKNVLVESDEQLMHLTRYLHLNPTTSHLVERPEDWCFSSYNEYLEATMNEEKICDYEDLLKINPHSYKRFVDERINYQRELAKVKKIAKN